MKRERRKKEGKEEEEETSVSRQEAETSTWKEWAVRRIYFRLEIRA